MTTPPSVTDRALSRRLERAEGRANAASVESRARLHPDSRATWCEVEGTFAMFDGVESPITQSFALGIDALPSEAGMARLEAFFRERGAPVMHEVSPLADPELLALLTGRGYRPIELTAVLHQPLAAHAAGAPDGGVPGIVVRAVGPGEEDRWADTSAAGWSHDAPELAPFIRDFGAITARAAGTACFLAEIDGVAAGAAGMAMHEGVALLAGASTRAEFRGRGVQAALLRARLRHAAHAGCDLAMMGAWPGSASQRNAERQGFRIAYTRIKWQLHAAPHGAG